MSASAHQSLAVAVDADTDAATPQPSPRARPRPRHPHHRHPRPSPSHPTRRPPLLANHHRRLPPPPPRHRLRNLHPPPPPPHQHRRRSPRPPRHRRPRYRHHPHRGRLPPKPPPPDLNPPTEPPPFSGRACPTCPNTLCPQLRPRLPSIPNPIERPNAHHPPRSSSSSSSLTPSPHAADPAAPPFTRKQDVDLRPQVRHRPDDGRLHARSKDANGAGVICRQRRLVLGPRGDQRPPASSTRWSSRGYTVFAVVHGSQPKFTIPEILAGHEPRRPLHPLPRQGLRDRPRPPRHHRRLGRRPPVADAGHRRRPGDPKAKDPVDRESSRVQAVACFFPPTDFLNYGKPGENALGRGIARGLPGPVRLPRARPEDQQLRPDHRRGTIRRDRPRRSRRSTTSPPTTRRR